MTTTTDTAQVLARLNGYEATHTINTTDAELANNVWEDVIYTLPGYDEAATDEIDRGRSDCFVAGGVEYRWDESTREWSAWVVTAPILTPDGRTVARPIQGAAWWCAMHRTWACCTMTAADDDRGECEPRSTDQHPAATIIADVRQAWDAATLPRSARPGDGAQAMVPVVVRALSEVGLQPDADELRLLAWLTGWEPETVGVLVRLMLRGREVVGVGE